MLLKTTGRRFGLGLDLGWSRTPKTLRWRHCGREPSFAALLSLEAAVLKASHPLGRLRGFGKV